MNIHKVNRVEIITEEGREHVYWHHYRVTCQLQDDGKTLKIFVEKRVTRHDNAKRT
jgi:hypothetical protein